MCPCCKLIESPWILQDAARPVSGRSRTDSNLSIVISWTICALFGAICSNMCLAIYGEYLWQPVDVLDKWMGTHVGRAFGFLCAAAWGIGNIGTVSNAFTPCIVMSVLTR